VSDWNLENIYSRRRNYNWRLPKILSAGFVKYATSLSVCEKSDWVKLVVKRASEKEAEDYYARQTELGVPLEARQKMKEFILENQPKRIVYEQQAEGALTEVETFITERTGKSTTYTQWAVDDRNSRNVQCLRKEFNIPNGALGINDEEVLSIQDILFMILECSDRAKAVIRYSKGSMKNSSNSNWRPSVIQRSTHALERLRQVDNDKNFCSFPYTLERRNLVERVGQCVSLRKTKHDKIKAEYIEKFILIRETQGNIFKKGKRLPGCAYQPQK